METLHDGRIKVEGVRPPERALHRNATDELLASYDIDRMFGSILIDQSDEQNFRFDTLFCGCKVLGAPRRLGEKIKVEIGIATPPQRYRRGYRPPQFQHPVLAAVDAGVARSQIVEFRIAGKRGVKAIFYRNTRTLCIGSLRTNVNRSLLISVTTDLVNRGYLDARSLPLRAPAPHICTTVGCDPEFEAIVNGFIVDAARIGGLRGTGETVELGRDGAGRQVEIRPAPSADPNVVVENIRKIMRQATFGLTCVGNTYPLGGHIHVGIGRAYSPHSDLRFLLDAFIGKPTINLSGQARGSYRNLGQTREQRWGFEYRSTPTACFWTPTFAYLSMKITQNITERFVNEEEFIFNSVPSLDDYVANAGLTPEEAAQFQQCIHDYQSWRMTTPMLEDIRNKWIEGISETAPTPAPETAPTPAPEPPPAPRPIPPPVVFRDDWDADARAMFLHHLTAHEIGTLPQIRLFGLAENRGNVTWGYEAEGSQRLEEGSWNGYGIPYHVRMTTPITDEQHAVIRNHAYAILAQHENNSIRREG